MLLRYLMMTASGLLNNFKTSNRSNHIEEREQWKRQFLQRGQLAAASA